MYDYQMTSKSTTYGGSRVVLTGTKYGVSSGRYKADLTRLPDMANGIIPAGTPIKMDDTLRTVDIHYAFEVENSTNFTSGIQRASNLDCQINKIMVLPDYREKEFLAIKDPLFIDNFKKYNWSYIFYNDIMKLKSLRTILISNIKSFLNKL